MKPTSVLSWLLFRVPLLIIVLVILASLVARAADHVILVDTSGSMTERISAKDKRIRIEVVQKALGEYVPALPASSRVYLMAFNSGVVSQKEITLGTPGGLEAALAWVNDLKRYAERNGGTHLWTSLRQALKKATDYSQQNAAEPVVVRVLTDGRDNENVTSLERVLKEFPLVDGEHIRGNLVLLGDLEIKTKHALPPGVFDSSPSLDWANLFPPVVLSIPSQPKVGEEVRFVENTKSVYATYDWRVDDEPAGNDKVLTWRFADTKRHRVSLNVKGITGSPESSVVVIAAIERAPLIAEIVTSADVAQPHQTVTLFAQLSEPASVQWLVNGQPVGSGMSFDWMPVAEGDGLREVRLADAGRADEQDIGGLADEVSGCELMDILARDRRVEAPVEVLEALQGGKLGGHGATRDFALLPHVDLVVQDQLQELGMGKPVRGGFLQPEGERLRERGQA